MDLSPEERQRIYQEEKARIEARNQIEQERREQYAAERADLTKKNRPKRSAGCLRDGHIEAS
jgi:hypothetical protein